MLFDYERWMPVAAAKQDAFRTASPYPHVVFEGFLEPAAAESALAAFPAADSPDWINWKHVNEKKQGKSRRETFPPAIGEIIDEFNSDRFVAFLRRLTGIEDLFADPSLQGGGIHQSVRGGFLNVHADFTAHPHHRDWERRVNVLVYLNKDWKDEYRGHLELWDRQMTRAVATIAPIFNRCVVFDTSKDSYHGHPDPLQCPDGVTRKSLALYYFTRTANVEVHATAYRARPSDSLITRIGIRLDVMALGVYHFLRRRFGFDDRVVSRILGFLSRKGPPKP